MTDFVLPLPVPPSVAIAGSSRRFPVRRIFCVGRNYAEHAREMGGDPDREEPFFFTKPADAVADSGSVIPFPPMTRDLHHEIELVVAIGKGGSDIPREAAQSCIWGYAVGVDLTRRDLQAAAKKAGRPWDWSKGFDRSAPCGPLRPAEEVGDISKGRIWLSVNGKTRQDADLSELIWPVPDIVAFCSQSVQLAPGDLIFTGTPAGVGPVGRGDQVAGGVDRVGEITFTIGD